MSKITNNADKRIAALEERVKCLERNFVLMDYALTSYSMSRFTELAELINKTMKTNKVDVKISPRAKKKVKTAINKTANSRVSN